MAVSEYLTNAQLVFFLVQGALTPFHMVTSASDTTLLFSRKRIFSGIGSGWSMQAILRTLRAARLAQRGHRHSNKAQRPSR